MLNAYVWSVNSFSATLQKLNTALLTAFKYIFSALHSVTSRLKPQVGTRLLLWWISITNRNDFLTRALKTRRHARRRLPSPCLNMDNVPVRVEIEKKKLPQCGARAAGGLFHRRALPEPLRPALRVLQATSAPVSVRITLLRRQHPRRNHGGHQEENADAEVG